jgi:hypothetical protein
MSDYHDEEREALLLFWNAILHDFLHRHPKVAAGLARFQGDRLRRYPPGTRRKKRYVKKWIEKGLPPSMCGE